MAHLQQNNLILSRLSQADLALLEPFLEPAELPQHKFLERRGQAIKAVYFPESGFASVVADRNSTRPIEVGLIGREGMTGLSVLLGNDRSGNDTYMQAAGSGRCIRTSDLRKALDKSVSLHRSMLRYAHAFLAQAMRTAATNGRCTTEERLARWLLMVADRLDNGELPLTHDLIALILAVRRPGVTLALQHLERERAITRRRGHIVICNRAKLEKLANGAYAPDEAWRRSL